MSDVLCLMSKFVKIVAKIENCYYLCAGKSVIQLFNYSVIRMARYLDPKADLTFKRIFIDHPHLLIHFLNSVIPFEPGRLIIDLEYLPQELVPDTPAKKFSVVDVRCVDNYKRQFIVEIQTSWYDAFMKRILFNGGKAYVRQLDKGEQYHLLQPVYTLSILTENFDHKTDSFYHHFQIINRENSDEIIPGLEFVLVELTEKFRPETILDRKLMVLWLRFLKEVNENMRTLPEEMQANKHIRQAAELCEEGAFTPEELARYEKFWDAIRVEKTVKISAEAIGLEKGKAIGLEEGLEKGEAIGLEKGEAIGLEKGEAIGFEKGEVVGFEKGETVGIEKGKIEGEAIGFEKVIINGFLAGQTINTIAIFTGLTPEQITAILKRKGLI